MGRPHRLHRADEPGLRALKKKCGLGPAAAPTARRFGLDDAETLIKDNHIAIAGSIATAIARARAVIGHLVKLEVEVDTLDQLAKALEAGVDAVLLDNIAPDNSGSVRPRRPAGDHGGLRQHYGGNRTSRRCEWR